MSVALLLRNNDRRRRNSEVQLFWAAQRHLPALDLSVLGSLTWAPGSSTTSLLLISPGSANESLTSSSSWESRSLLSLESRLDSVPSFLWCCLTSTEAGWPIRDGDRVGRGQGDWLDRGNRPKKTGETVDRRQNNGSVKAVSPRHCPATCALRNCSFNCCAGQSH